MTRRPNGTAGAALLLLLGALVAAPLGAQAVDSTRRWSLFGGTVAGQGLGILDTGLERLGANFQLGGSGDFRIGAFPLPLRATLAVSQVEDSGAGASLHFGTFSLDAVARPLPRVLGTQLYFLGGLGVGTQASYFGSTPGALTASRQPGRSWAFTELGSGIDVGRMFFDVRLQVPVASNGLRRLPISVGFRF